MMDPGGARGEVDVASLVNSDIFLLKPNDEEATKITGIKITDNNSAIEAAKKLLSMGPQHVLLTRGKDGAVLASKDGEKLLECPLLNEGAAGDATGCGEQSFAAMCASIHRGKDIQTAANMAVLAGTLQYHRDGVVPITEKDLAVAAK
jgi:ribokinase